MNFNPDDEKTYASPKDDELIKSLIHAMERQKPAILGELVIRLKKSINNLEASSSRQTKQMIWLTWVLVVLTFVLVSFPFLPWLVKH